MKDLILTLSDKLKKREISSVELTKAYISAIERQNSQLFAYVHTTFDEALKNAEYADKLIKEGGEISPLCGIPMTLKDNISTDGLPTTCCSKILKDFKPCFNATVWEKLKKSGAVLLGKTNMDEFAMGSTSENSCYGPPSNPRDINKVCGGSSGGGASAVAGNLAAYALGSDTGGSIRQPAAFCGVVGFKPSYGSVSRYGLVAFASSLDQIGPIAPSVSDAALVFDGIKGADSRDMTSRDFAGKTRLTGDIKGLKVGVAKEFFTYLNPDTERAVKAAIKTFESAGAEIVEMSVPSMKVALQIYMIVSCAEASSNLGRFDGIRYGFRASEYKSVEDMVIKTRTEGFGAEVKRRIMLGTFVLSSGYMDAYYKKACLLREKLCAEMENVFSKCDLLLTPTTPLTAFDKGYSGTKTMEMYNCDLYTIPANCAQLPAVSVPCGADKNGLPIGLQLIGPKGKDESVLNGAYFFEKSANIEFPEYKGGFSL